MWKQSGFCLHVCRQLFLAAQISAVAQQVKDPVLSLQSVAVVWVQSLAQELPHAMVTAKKKKKKEKIPYGLATFRVLIGLKT